MYKKISFLSFGLLLLLSACSNNGNMGNHTMDSSNSSMNMDHNSNKNDMGMMGHGANLEMKDSTGENDLRIPQQLFPNKGSLQVVAEEGETEFFKGVKTKTLGYNGSYLGPVLRLKKGETVTIQTINHLSEETTFHWHGLEVPGNADGGPHQVIPSGDSKHVKFTVNQEASTLWFHPHPMGKTAKQVYEGLAGLVYIEDENSLNSGLPNEYGVDDIPLILQDRQFTTDKQFNYDQIRLEDGTVGDTMLINGTVNPRLRVNQEKMRFRLLNGSNARNMTLKLSNNQSFQQIATDGGLLNQPIDIMQITLGPAERAEILVDFSKLSVKDSISFVNEDEKVLLPFVIKNLEKNASAPLNKLNDFQVTREEMKMNVSKHIELFGMGNMVYINGKKFDMDRIDFTQKQNETEIWEIYNKPDMMGGMTHPFHIHGSQFKIVSVDGEQPPAHLNGWKDTVSIQPGQRVKLAVRFKEKGVYMFHCHILEHEENGMMGQVKIE